MATAVIANPGDAFAMMSRPQIGIDRLPVRRQSNESREAMNCKSCRKRKVSVYPIGGRTTVLINEKIKCNRLKPSCEACQVFNCACVYGKRAYKELRSSVDCSTDAVPKKRGPKTDVLEALLKRVNGLEKRLKDEKKPGSPDGIDNPSSTIHAQEQQEVGKCMPPAEQTTPSETPRQEKQPKLSIAEPVVQYATGSSHRLNLC